MKKTRFTETQIVKAIQEHENGRDATYPPGQVHLATVSKLI